MQNLITSLKNKNKKTPTKCLTGTYLPKSKEHVTKSSNRTHYCSVLLLVVCLCFARGGT